MDDDDLTAKEGAGLFGITTPAFHNRTRTMSGHPQPVRDERLGRVFWRLGDLQTFSKAYHERQSSRCLFSPSRLRTMTDAELEAWGIVIHSWQEGARVA